MVFCWSAVQRGIFCMKANRTRRRSGQQMLTETRWSNWSDQELLWAHSVSVWEANTVTRNANNYIYYQLQQDSLFGPHATRPDYTVDQTFQLISAVWLTDWLTRSLIMWFNELLVIIHCYTHVTSRLLVNIIIADHQIELKVWIWTFSPLTIVNWFISHSWSPENLWPHILLYFITITSGLVENYPDFEFTLLASANYMCLSSQYC